LGEKSLPEPKRVILFHRQRRRISLKRYLSEAHLYTLG
jgi:hypothetical protein